MNYSKTKYSTKLKKANYCFFLISILISFGAFGQIPERAILIADSIRQTRMFCPNTIIQLEDSIYYPVFKNEYQDRKTESYFFVYNVHFRSDLITDLNISIKYDFSIKYVNGFPDSLYQYSPCNLMERESLWNIAKKNGLNTKFKKCRYSIYFDDHITRIVFYEKKSKYDVDHYTINAVTGEYLGHVKMNVNF